MWWGNNVDQKFSLNSASPHHASLCYLPFCLNYASQCRSKETSCCFSERLRLREASNTQTLVQTYTRMCFHMGHGSNSHMRFVLSNALENCTFSPYTCIIICLASYIFCNFHVLWTDLFLDCDPPVEIHWHGWRVNEPGRDQQSWHIACWNFASTWCVCLGRCLCLRAFV